MIPSQNPYDTKGGARPGTGRPKGSMDDSTKLRRDAERAYKERVAKITPRLLNAQLSNALGETNLFVKRSYGQGSKKRYETRMIDDPNVIVKYLNGELDDSPDDEFYFIATKTPDDRALENMLDRTYGKPKQSMDLTSGDEPIQPVQVGPDYVGGFLEYMKEVTKSKHKDHGPKETSPKQ